MKAILYLNGSKELNRMTADELGLTEKAAHTFQYTCYEVSITIEVDPETGKSMATHFEGVKLERPVAV